MRTTGGLRSRSDGLKEEFKGRWRAGVRLWIGGSGHGEKGRAKLGRANRAEAILCACASALFRRTWGVSVATSRQSGN